MGGGDFLMVLGEAEKIYNETGKKVYLPDRFHYQPKKMGWNAEFITNDPREGVRIPQEDYSNMYIKKKTDKKHIFQKYRPIPFRIRATEKELQEVDEKLKQYNIPENFIVINPDTKLTVFPGKDWGKHKWIELADKLSKKFFVVRFHAADFPGLNNVLSVPTKFARESFLLASKSMLTVTYEGGFAHAMAGFDVPTVVIWGGLTSPEYTGYDKQINLYINDPLSPCGSRSSCQHCVEANKRITVDMVYDAIISEHKRIKK